MNPSHGPFALLRRLALAAALFTTAACSGNAPPTPTATASIDTMQNDVLQLLAVEGDRLLLVTAGAHRVLATSPLLDDVSALAFDASRKTAYAIARASSAPLLLKIDSQSGDVTEIGPVQLPPIITRTADAMVFDPRSERLYIAAGHKGISKHMIAVDPQTGATTRLGRIRNTSQGEIDGLALVRGVFYAIDHVSDETHLYELTLKGLGVKPLGKLPGKITDLAGDSRGGRLYAALDGHLVTLRIAEGLSSVPMGGSPTLTALTLISSGPGLFSDGFEGGDLSAWSESGNNRKN